MRTRSIRPSLLAAGLAVGVLLAAGGVLAAKKGRAVFQATSRDFGKVKQGDVLTHEFVFKNEGEGPLVVEKVETTCGCTAALVSEDRIDPGREGRIKATFDTRGYQGRLTRFIYFVSNDSDKPRRELSVSADIEVPPSARIEVDKYNIDLGLVLEGESPVFPVKVKNTGERELRVEIAHPEVRFTADGKPVSFPLLIPAGNSKDIEFRFAPQSRLGILRDYVLIKSNDPVRQSWSVYVSRYVISKKELKDLFQKYRSVIDEKD